MRSRISLSALTFTIALGTSTALVSPLSGQSAGIRGYLVNRTSQTPISDANITIADSVLLGEVRAGRDGRFSWTAPRPGRYTIKAMAIGYVPGEWSLEL